MPIKCKSDILREFEEIIESPSVGWLNDTMTRKEFKNVFKSFLSAAIDELLGQIPTEENKDPQSCPFCEAEMNSYARGWGFSPEGWREVKENHEKTHVLNPQRLKSLIEKLKQ